MYIYKYIFSLRGGESAATFVANLKGVARWRSQVAYAPTP